MILNNFVLIMLMLGEEKEPYKREFKTYEIVGVYEDSKSCSERLDKIELDFNKSYNPFCVYDKKFSCPIPSKRNYIDIKIEAGEKI